MKADQLQARAPHTEDEWQRYYDLRWRILRAPWQQDGPDRDETDATSIHRMVCTPEGKVLAVGRIHKVNDQAAQVRFMAVEAGHERKGYGSRLLCALEQVAHELELGSVILQARENAVPFYRHHGYRVVDKTFMLFDEIQHYLMRKQLDD